MPDWFEAAKLGIFVHWGIYAVDGVTESWSFFNGRVSVPDYYAQLPSFGAERYDPDAWAQRFVAAGARYAVLTTKHHDGVCLWPTETGSPVVPPVAEGRDLVGEWCAALRRHGLRVGLYYSHLDWHHPDYASIRPAGMDADERGNPLAVPAAGEEDPDAWARFRAFHLAQLDELLDRYQPDLLWFDGDWERDADQWDMPAVRAHIAERSPQTICNGRMLGSGDYATPEQGVPVVPPDGPWELCLTINDSWGWQPSDTRYAPAHRLIRVLVECVAAGGNLLLDVGPRPDGTIDERYLDRLDAIGRWSAANRPALDAGRGLPAHCFDGPTTVSSDGRHVYLFCFARPLHELSLRGLGVAVRSARILGAGTTLEVDHVGGHLDNAGWDYVVVPPELGWDDVCTVLDVELAEPLALRTTHERD